ncbi:hypothetical protein H9X86_05200 [Pseudoflavonifractor capillosus]|uniref:hypothetical protein n=1 Tax=Pseudoflavonifractor capillosus TaxID=106588 RepID=UPI00195B5F76|nr:hypothetical protein [Pseudoflavonifractor capillosus]MBM6896768.1 hypothetical protein [Pseudoflavonifractor capillosus]
MTEVEKIAYARSYIQKLANGINPLTGQEVSEGDVINHVKISRCLFYVSDVLGQVVENGGVSLRKRNVRKLPFQLDYQAREAFRYSEAPIPISEITRRINELIQPEEMTKLSYRHILEWLIEIGLLVLVTDASGKMIRKPTRSGEDLGITVEQRQSPRGAYTVVVYSKAAQEFILDNLDGAIGRSQKLKSSQ